MDFGVHKVNENRAPGIVKVDVCVARYWASNQNLLPSA